MLLTGTLTPMPMTVGMSALKIQLQECKLGPCLQRATGDWLRVRNKDGLHHRYEMISSDIIDGHRRRCVNKMVPFAEQSTSHNLC